MGFAQSRQEVLRLVSAHESSTAHLALPPILAPPTHRTPFGQAVESCLAQHQTAEGSIDGVVRLGVADLPPPIESLGWVVRRLARRLYFLAECQKTILAEQARWKTVIDANNIRAE